MIIWPPFILQVSILSGGELTWSALIQHVEAVLSEEFNKTHLGNITSQARSRDHSSAGSTENTKLNARHVSVMVYQRSKRLACEKIGMERFGCIIASWLAVGQYSTDSQAAWLLPWFPSASENTNIHQSTF